MQLTWLDKKELCIIFEYNNLIFIDYADYTCTICNAIPKSTLWESNIIDDIMNN